MDFCYWIWMDKHPENFMFKLIKYCLFTLFLFSAVFDSWYLISYLSFLQINLLLLLFSPKQGYPFCKIALLVDYSILLLEQIINYQYSRCQIVTGMSSNITLFLKLLHIYIFLYECIFQQLANLILLCKSWWGHYICTF